MMSKGDTQSRKVNYFEKVHTLFREYNKIFIVNVDNVTSTQLHQIRMSLRGEAVILMGKNTMVRKGMRELLGDLPKIESLFPHIFGNIGLIFTNGDLKSIRDKIIINRVTAPAKVDAISQRVVSIPAGNTGIQPDKTSFFQALGIPTKIVKGAIEIMNDVVILKQGDKVGASECELLGMLSIMPFSYGLTVKQIYDNGTVFAPEILDITDDVLIGNLAQGIKNIACISLALNFPTTAAVPHSLASSYKKILSVGIATEYSFPAVEKIKAILANPAVFAAVTAPVTVKKEAAKPIEKVEEKEESEEEMGFGLFD